MVTNTCPCIPEIGHWQKRENAAGEVHGHTLQLLERFFFCFNSGETTTLEFLKAKRTKEIQLDKATNSIFFWSSNIKITIKCSALGILPCLLFKYSTDYL